MPTMTPKQIKHALDNAGFTQVQVAEACKVSGTHVNQVINGTATSHRVRCYIAKLIERPVGQVWKVKKDPTKVGRPLSRLNHQAA